MKQPLALGTSRQERNQQEWFDLMEAGLIYIVSIPLVHPGADWLTLLKCLCM